MIGIASQSKNHVIGKDGGLPWGCSEDLAFFKHMTINKSIIVGSTTFKTLPVLPNRDLYILTRRNIEEVKLDVNIYLKVIPYFSMGRQAVFINEPFEAPEDSFLCGGGQIYKEYMECCECFYLTTVDKEVDGDTYFPIEEFLEIFKRKEEIERGNGYVIERYRK